MQVCCLVSPMYSKEIYKQLELIKEVLALHALDSSYPHARECSVEALDNKRKIKQRLKDICFPEEVEL